MVNWTGEGGGTGGLVAITFTAIIPHIFNVFNSGNIQICLDTTARYLMGKYPRT
jgi:hypothetical protein